MKCCASPSLGEKNVVARCDPAMFLVAPSAGWQSRAAPFSRVAQLLSRCLPRSHVAPGGRRSTRRRAGFTPPGCDRMQYTVDSPKQEAYILFVTVQTL